MSIAIIDTSVFCNLLKVPQMCGDHEQAMQKLGELVRNRESLLLPLATIYETGNHIAQNGTGGQRRSAAERFVRQVTSAFSGDAPWTPTPIHSSEDLVEWLPRFPESAMRGVSLGDLSIVEVYREHCRLHPSQRVFIWSYDQHLRAYDREP